MNTLMVTVLYIYKIKHNRIEKAFDFANVRETLCKKVKLLNFLQQNC